MGGWMDGWMNGCVGGWMDRYRKRYRHRWMEIIEVSSSILSIDLHNRRFVSRIYKEALQLTNTKDKPLNFKMDKEFNRYFTKEHLRTIDMHTEKIRQIISQQGSAKNRGELPLILPTIITIIQKTKRQFK